MQIDVQAASFTDAFFPYTNLHDAIIQKLKYSCRFIFPFSGKKAKQSRYRPGVAQKVPES